MASRIRFSNSNQVHGSSLLMRRQVMKKYLSTLTRTNQEMSLMKKCKKLFNKQNSPEIFAHMFGNWSIQEEKILFQRTNSSWLCSFSVKLKVDYLYQKRFQQNSFHQPLTARWCLFLSSNNNLSSHKHNLMHHHLEKWPNLLNKIHLNLLLHNNYPQENLRWDLHLLRDLKWIWWVVALLLKEALLDSLQGSSLTSRKKI